MHELADLKNASGERVETFAIEANDSSGTSVEGVNGSNINPHIPAKFHGTSVDDQEMRAMGRHQELNVQFSKPVASLLFDLADSRTSAEKLSLYFHFRLRMYTHEFVGDDPDVSWKRSKTAFTALTRTTAPSRSACLMEDLQVSFGATWSCLLVCLQSLLLSLKWLQCE